MSENLIDQIYLEIQRTGYPTELIVNRKFRLKNWLCTENEYYIDQDENKGREIDLKAQTNVYCHDPKDIFVWSMLSIEIKKSEKPWVIFTSEKTILDTGGYGFLNIIILILNSFLLKI